MEARRGARSVECPTAAGRFAENRPWWQVICEDKELLYDEAPEAYKGIDRVVADLVDAGLCRVVATLRPVLTYKVRRPAHKQPGVRKPKRGRR